MESKLKIENPLKGITEYGWHYEQNVYSVNTVIRAIKAGGGTGNIPKIIQVKKIDKEIYIKCKK